MKEMVKSKYMMGFVVFILGVSYFNSLNVSNLDTQKVNDKEIIMNSNN